MNPSILKVKVWRGTDDGEFVEYDVPRAANQTVLDVVTYIKRKIDPTLSYRFACRVGMCGSCAMTVNGKARWTCRTHVAKIADQNSLEIAPLDNLPIIKDLATDMREFFDKMSKAVGYFKGIRPDLMILLRSNQIQKNVNLPTLVLNALVVAFVMHRVK